MRVAPRDDLEAALCEEFADVLGVEVGITDNFFSLGGHSLMATKLATRISRRLDVRLSVKDVFDYPVIADLAATMSQGSYLHRPIPHTDYSGPVDLSYAQGRLWFLDQLALGSSWYVMPLATRLRGPLQVDALTTAVRALEERHETLRTTFEERDGVGIQIVHARCFKDLRIIDVAAEKDGGYEQALRREQETPFNLAAEPGVRVCLLRLAEDDHILSFVLHHIISDGWSVDVLRKELGLFYAAARRGEDPLLRVNPLPIQYRDFAVWQKQDDQLVEQQKQLEYWTQQLEGSSPAELLTDRTRPKVLSGEASAVPFAIEAELYQSLQAFCKSRQMTPFVVLLAAFRATHYRLTGAEDACIGTPIANRNRPELENMIGFFVNTQCMRITVEDDTFEELTQKVRSTATAAFANQDVPFERIVSALLPGSRDTSRNPLVQLLLAVHSQKDMGRIQLESLQAEPIGLAVTTRFDIEFHLFQESDRLSGGMVFSTQLFEAETIHGLLAVFREILHQGLENPQTSIATMPLTDGLAELRSNGLLQIEWTAYPRESSVIDIFREQVAAFPDATAVKDSSSQLTYAELDRQSDELAVWLLQRRLPAESLVGVLSPRCCQTIIAFLGILKANLAYLPLDINVPAARIEAILATVAGPKLVLLGPDVSPPALQLSDLELVRIGDTLSGSKLGHRTLYLSTDPTTQPGAKSLAYVIFTSGSTGNPKGVMVEHRGIIRLVKQSNVVSMLPQAPHVAHLTNISFDVSAGEVYAALLNGGTLVCIDYTTTLDSQAFAAAIAREQIRVAMLPPALLKQYLADIPDAISSLDVLYVAGDRFDSRDAIEAQGLVRGSVYNAYGPTENTVLSTVYSVGNNEQFVNGVPIGRAVSNSGAYVMDQRQQLVPPGVMGELVVTGDGLARGYTDPALDKDRFVHVSIEGEQLRAYRTGDRARYRPKDGQIEFFGRMDRQIKIRGHRIELAEVEQAILSQDSVRDAAVVADKQDGEELEMVAFVAARLQSELSESGIRAALQTILPLYMVPARIVVLDQLPVNINGKVDRNALARMAQVTPRSRPTPIRVAPRNDLEAALCDEFSHLLCVEVGIFDNFFNLGGHSLMVTKLATRMSRRLDVRISVKDIIEFPTVAECAGHIISSDDQGRFRTPAKGILGQISSATTLEDVMNDIDTLVSDLPVPDTTQPVNRDEPPREIFLTGGTGYLGTTLLHHLLQNSHVRRVTVLVRAPSVEQARLRIISSAAVAGWWHDEYEDRVRYWLGDLQRLHLGLSDSQWLELSGAGGPHGSIDAIVHSGAVVNFYHSYDMLRAANIISTYQLLGLASSSPSLKQFVYISTAPWVDVDHSDFDKSALPLTLKVTNGYVWTKLAAERMLFQATMSQQRASHRTLIVKAGFIIGNAASGIANVDDFLWRVVAGSVSIGCFPEEPDCNLMYISSLDGLATAVTETMYSINHTGLAKLRSPTLSTRQFWQAVNAALPNPLVARPVKEWQAEIYAKMDELGSQHPISPVLHMVAHSDQILGQVPHLSECQSSDYESGRQEDLLAAATRSVRYLFDIGYFSKRWTTQSSDRFFSRMTYNAEN